MFPIIKIKNSSEKDVVFPKEWSELPSRTYLVKLDGTIIRVENI